MPATASRSSRERILAAALSEFNAHGVAGASIEEIRQRSGASVGSIYHHFGAKLELAAELYAQAMDEYQRGFLQELEAADSARAGVERTVHFHLGWVEQNDEVARFLLLGSEAAVRRARGPTLKTMNRRFFAAVEQWSAPYVAAGELRELDLDVMTAAWIGPAQELARHWLSGRSSISPTTAAPALATAAWRSLCP